MQKLVYGDDIYWCDDFMSRFIHTTSNDEDDNNNNSEPNDLMCDVIWWMCLSCVRWHRWKIVYQVSYCGFSFLFILEAFAGVKSQTIKAYLHINDNFPSVVDLCATCAASFLLSHSHFLSVFFFFFFFFTSSSFMDGLS